MSVTDVLARQGPRRLLSVDSGGLRGVIAIEILAAIEHLMREMTGRPDLVLADVFDYMAGTSTGAIIAAMLALGLSTDQIGRFYSVAGPLIFAPARLRDRWRSSYESEPLAHLLREAFGAETTLGSDRLRTLLLLVLRDATTDSPWPLSNNPHALYNQPDLPACNLLFPLWQLVRASTAAPFFFPPEVIDLAGHAHTFIDGAISPYGNPALQLFVMATAPSYRLGWPTGEARMLLVSVGTGVITHARPDLSPHDMGMLFNMVAVPQALLQATSAQQDMLCRLLGRCRVGAAIDTEVGTLIGEEIAGLPKLFTYLRYDATLSREGLDALGLTHIQPEDLQHLAPVAHLAEMQEVGKRVAHDVRADHFAGFLPMP